MSLLTARNKFVRIEETVRSVREELDEILEGLGISVDNPSPGQFATKHKGRKPGSKNKPKAPAAMDQGSEPAVIPAAGLTPAMPVESAAS